MLAILAAVGIVLFLLFLCLILVVSITTRKALEQEAKAIQEHLLKLFSDGVRMRDVDVLKIVRWDDETPEVFAIPQVAIHLEALVEQGRLQCVIIKEKIGDETRKWKEYFLP